MNKIEEARLFFREGHKDQKRKYTGLPYSNHTEEVAELVHNFLGENELAIITAFAHDAVEDLGFYPYNLQGIQENFGIEVAACVDGLTHQFTTDQYPYLNREVRKTLEAGRLYQLGQASFGYIIHSVKCADLLDNCRDIAVNDPGFAITYIKEKALVLDLLWAAETSIWKAAADQVRVLSKKLDIKLPKYRWL